MHGLALPWHAAWPRMPSFLRSCLIRAGHQRCMSYGCVELCRIEINASTCHLQSRWPHRGQARAVSHIASSFRGLSAPLSTRSDAPSSLGQQYDRQGCKLLHLLQPSAPSADRPAWVCVTGPGQLDSYTDPMPGCLLLHSASLTTQALKPAASPTPHPNPHNFPHGQLPTTC